MQMTPCLDARSDRASFVLAGVRPERRRTFG